MRPNVAHVDIYNNLLIEPLPQSLINGTREFWQIIKRVMGRRSDIITLQVVVLILAVAMLCLAKLTFGDSTASKPAPDVRDVFKENQIKLYDVLRQFALPDLDYDSNDLQHRFILQVPGKILNPTDFYPGQAYIDYLNNPENYTERVDVPQQVMEKMFSLVDIVPGAHPVAGESTDYSLARLYESILSNLDQVGYDDLNEQAKQKYNESLAMLAELIPDPDNSSSQTPLLDVYAKLQKAYHDEQQKVDRTIREKRKQLDDTNYQKWLERNHHILDAQVETAYKRWLHYGKKLLTESYIVHLDIASSEETLDRARLDLRSSEFSMSQDWLQKGYPVSLSPSNWFRYLNISQDTSPTIEQLQAKQEELRSRIALLEKVSKKSANKIEDKQLRVVQHDCNEKEKHVWKKVDELEYLRKRCWLMFDSQSCDFWEKEEEVKDALSDSTAANFKLEMLKLLFGDSSSLKQQIDLVVMKLRNETMALQERIVNGASATLPPIVTGVGDTQQLSSEELRDQWQYFEFSSKGGDNSATETFNSIDNVLFFNPKPSSFPGHNTFASIVQNATVFIKAKLLKVKINRPWFKESLFHDRELKLKKTRGKLVSPGYMREIDFYSEITKKSPDGSPAYMLYQYPTAFLLAKDITMDFTGLSDKDIQRALVLSFSTSLKGNYGPISFDGSFSGYGSQNHIQASLMDNGIKVRIPGAQIVGYYCNVVPKFPNTYNSTEFSN